MFDGYLQGQKGKPWGQRLGSSALSIVVHAAVVLALAWISFGPRKERSKPEVTLTFFAGLPPPPPPPPPAPARRRAPRVQPKEPSVETPQPTQLVQPKTSETAEVEPQTEPQEGEPGGVVGGVPGGVVGGVVGGTLGGVIGGTGPPVLEKPKFVPPTVLDRQRSYDPPPEYPGPARAAGIEGQVTLRICTDTSGNVTEVDVVRGNPIFDEAARKGVRRWKYRPYTVDGRAVPVCGLVTIKFTQH